MYHPLLTDIRKLKDSDLEEKVIDLSKKYGIAMRLGQGAAAQQIIMILDAYKSELSDRQRKSLETAGKKNKDLDNLINVD
jgi:hypothetical protein